MSFLPPPSLPALLVSFALGLLPAGSWAQEPAWLTPPPQPVLFEAPLFEMGEIYQFQIVEHRFPVENRSSSPVRILKVEAISNAATARAEPEVLPPGGRGEIAVRQPVGNKLGEVSFRFQVRTDHPEVLERKLVLRGFVQSAFDPEVSRIDFGEVERGTGAAQEIEVESREVAGFRVIGVDEAPPWLAVEPVGGGDPVPQGVRVRLAIRPGAALGAQSGKVYLRTDVPQQPRLEVSYRAQIFGDIVPDEATLDLGVARLGQVTEKTVALKSRGGRPLEIEKVDGAVEGLVVTGEPCAENRPSCQELHLRLSPSAPGSITGTLLVRLRGESEPLPLPYGALAVEPETTIREISPLAPDPGYLPFVPVSKLPAPPAEPSVPASRREVALRWRAAQEERVYGYLVYRSTSRSGPFLRLSPRIVRAGGPEGRYEYVDRTVEPGVTYFYYLDSVSRSGGKQRFSGVLSRSVAADAQP